MTTEERLENVERELVEAKAQATRAKRRNRWLLAAVTLAAGVFALVWIVAGAANRAQAQGGGVSPVIRAGRFELVDGNGRTCAVLSTFGGGARLALGENRAVLAVGKGGGGLVLCDEKGLPRAALDVEKDGPALRLLDANLNTRASLGVMVTRTPDGKTITHPESSLILSGPDGKVKWQAP